MGGGYEGFRAIVDKTGVESRLRRDLVSWHSPELVAPAFDGGTQVWINYLLGKLRHCEARF